MSSTVAVAMDTDIRRHQTDQTPLWLREYSDIWRQLHQRQVLAIEKESKLTTYEFVCFS